VALGGVNMSKVKLYFFSANILVVLSALSFCSINPLTNSSISRRNLGILDLQTDVDASTPQYDFHKIETNQLATKRISDKEFSGVTMDELSEFPPIFIAIDESLSLDREFRDGTGKCDSTSNRYKIPLFLLKLFNRWYDNDIIQHDFNTTLAYLTTEIDVYESQISDVDFHTYWGLENKITEEKFSSKMLYEQLFNKIGTQGIADEKLQLILFTDGELSDIGDKNRTLSSLEKGRAYDLMAKLTGLLIQLSKSQNAFIHIFLLCPDKLGHVQKTWWAGINSLDNVFVYGLDDNKIIVDRVESLIKNILLVRPDFFDNEWTGWGIIDSRKIETIEIDDIPHNAQTISWHVYSVDKLLGNEVYIIPAELDGVKFSSGELIWPLHNCQNHRLEIDIDEQEEGMYFYWWDSEPIEILVDLDGTNALIMNNSNAIDTEEFQYKVQLSDNYQREMKWGKLGRCFFGRIAVEDFLATFEFNDSNIEQPYLILERESFLPFDEYVPDDYESELLIELVSKILEVPIASQIWPLTIRFHPVFQQADLLYPNSNDFTTQILLKFNYLSSRYYPHDWMNTLEHEPRVTFRDPDGKLYNSNCPFKKERYMSGTKYNDAFLFNILDDEITIEITNYYSNSDDAIEINECQKFMLYWDDWSSNGDNWQEPQNIIFELDWDCDDGKCIIEQISHIEIDERDG